MIKMSEDEKEESAIEKRARVREEVMRALDELEHKHDYAEDQKYVRDSVPTTKESGRALGGCILAPRWLSDNLYGWDDCAERACDVWRNILNWDEATKTWKHSGGGLHSTTSVPSLLFVYGAGKDGQGAHYRWNEQRKLWVPRANPPKPPPEGARLSSSDPGFANGYQGKEFVYYQWDEEGKDWILVGPVPSGYRGVYTGTGRLEAASLDDFHVRIYWDGKLRSWVDQRTGKAPALRPLPPNSAATEEGHEEMAHVEGTEAYYLWNKDKQKWVSLKSCLRASTEGTTRRRRTRQMETPLTGG